MQICNANVANARLVRVMHVLLLLLFMLYVFMYLFMYIIIIILSLLLFCTFFYNYFVCVIFLPNWASAWTENIHVSIMIFKYLYYLCLIQLKLHRCICLFIHAFI